MKQPPVAGNVNIKCATACDVSMKTVFICGTLPENSGKTTFCRTLIAFLLSKGITVIPFKPLSAHSIWWQYDHYLQCVRMRNIISQDAFELWRESKGPERNIPIEAINPADMLMSIPNMEFLAKYPMDTRSTLVTTSPFTWFYAGRFSLWNEKPEHVFYCRQSKLLFKPTPDIIEIIGKDRFITIKSEYEFLKLHKKYYSIATSSAFSKLVTYEPDVIVIESFNDSVYPCNEVRHATVVISVSPAYIMTYEPKEFFEAVLKNPNPHLCTFSMIASESTPTKVFNMRPVPHSLLKNGNALAKHYFPILEEILETYLR